MDISKIHTPRSGFHTPLSDLIHHATEMLYENDMECIVV